MATTPAFLFDLDGTLVDSVYTHVLAWRAALEAVGRGEALLDPAMMNKAFARLREAARKDRGEAFKMLTEQETKIVALIARGRTNREIAGELFLSEKTVRNYVSSILGKLGLSHRAQAAAYAVEHGLPGVSQAD